MELSCVHVAVYTILLSIVHRDSVPKMFTTADPKRKFALEGNCLLFGWARGPCKGRTLCPGGNSTLQISSEYNLHGLFAAVNSKPGSKILTHTWRDCLRLAWSRNESLPLHETLIHRLWPLAINTGFQMPKWTSLSANNPSKRHIELCAHPSRIALRMRSPLVNGFYDTIEYIHDCGRQREC